MTSFLFWVNYAFNTAKLFKFKHFLSQISSLKSHLFGSSNDKKPLTLLPLVLWSSWQPLCTAPSSSSWSSPGIRTTLQDRQGDCREVEVGRGRMEGDVTYGGMKEERELLIHWETRSRQIKESIGAEKDMKRWHRSRSRKTEWQRRDAKHMPAHCNSKRKLVTKNKQVMLWQISQVSHTINGKIFIPIRTRWRC